MCRVRAPRAPELLTLSGSSPSSPWAGQQRGRRHHRVSPRAESTSSLASLAGRATRVAFAGQMPILLFSSQACTAAAPHSPFGSCRKPCRGLNQALPRAKPSPALCQYGATSNLGPLLDQAGNTGSLTPPSIFASQQMGRSPSLSWAATPFSETGPLQGRSPLSLSFLLVGLALACAVGQV